MKRVRWLLLVAVLLLTACKNAAPAQQLHITVAPTTTTAATSAVSRETESTGTTVTTTAAVPAPESTAADTTAPTTQTEPTRTTAARTTALQTTTAQTTTQTRPATTTQPRTTAAKKPVTTQPRTTTTAAPTTTAPAVQQCTISISCATALRSSALDAAQRAVLPADGVLLRATTVTFSENESVFDVLKRTCRTAGIPMEFSMTPGYQTAYIEGIGNLYEFDCGPMSGWMYAVNGSYPNYGCSKYLLKSGDVITWKYTCDLGADIGGAGAEQQ